MPTIHLDTCIKCMKCVTDCPSTAIDIETGIINENCIHCGHCVAICPVSCISPDDGDIHPLVKQNISPKDYRALSAGVRSCRQYLDKHIPQDLIDDLVDNMKHYASASNARPVKINIIQSSEKIQKLNDDTTQAMIKTLQMVTGPLIKPLMNLFVPSMDLSGLSEYKDRFIKKQEINSSQVCHFAPLVMLFHAPKSKYGMAKEDALIWATNTINYASTMGLGTCHIGFIVKAMERSKAMRREYHIPEGNVVHAALILGYPKVKYVNETSRKAPEVVLL